MRRVVAAAFALVAVVGTGCIPIPIPHEVTLTPRITGTVVAEETRLPVSGAEVSVTGTKLATRTGADGSFTIPESRGWHPYWTIPLLPLCPAAGRLELVVAPPGRAAEGAEACVSTFSYQPPTAVLGDTGRHNRENPVEAGVIVVPTAGP